jgi:hypothetical protein
MSASSLRATPIHKSRRREIQRAILLEGLVTLSMGLPFRDFSRNHL